MAFSVADIQGRWNEPPRGPKGLGRWIAPNSPGQTFLIPQSSSMLLGRYPPLSEPVRLKPGLGSRLQHFIEIVPPAYFGPPTPPSSGRWVEGIHESNWHYPWSEPANTKLTKKPSITAGSQQAYAGPVRLLPAPSVFVTMSAQDSVNTDVVQISINVYDDQSDRPDLSGANVSIIEVNEFGVIPVSIRTED